MQACSRVTEQPATPPILRTPRSAPMPRKTMRQKNATNQPTTSTRKHSCSHRVQKRAATMTTEYQERFLPPGCYKIVDSKAKQKGPYHPLKGTSTDITTLRSTCVAKKHPPKAPQPSMQPPKVHQRCSSAPHNPTCPLADQMASKITEYNDRFQAWEVNKREPIKLVDNLKVDQGLVVTNGTFKKCHCSVQAAANSKEVQEPQPAKITTSYRSDFVTHPVQPRTRKEKPAYQTKGLPLEPAVSSKPKPAWDVNQEVLDEDSKLFQQFKTWSLENNFHGRGKAKEPSPPADSGNFLSTTHADYTAHKCQRTKPVLPSMQTGERSKEPFQGTTTMKDDYKAWDTPRRFPSVRKDHDWPEKSTFSPRIPKSAESCKTALKPLSPHPKLNETQVCNCSCNSKKKTPAENGALSSLGSISLGTEESRMGWTTSLDRGVTWGDKEASQVHQTISCVASSQS